MIQELQNLGLSELEAKCYASLLAKPEQTGYEVAKDIGSSRSNVYASLKSLLTKGAVVMIEGQSTLYTAINPEDFSKMIQSQFEKSIETFKKVASTQQQTSYKFYSTEGLKAVEALLVNSIHRAKHSIVADLNGTDFDLFLPELEKSQDSGVKVTLVSDRDVNTKIIHTIIDSEIKTKDDTTTSFSLLLDDAEVILGSFDASLQPVAMITQHPSLVKQMKSAYEHDLVMSVLYKDYGEEFDEKYGKHFEKIIKKGTI